MFKYTRSMVGDSFDLIKRLIFVFQIVIQFLYLAYITYRIIDNVGRFSFNIALLVLSLIYLIAILATRREFYTKEQLFKRNIFKWIVKGSKYILNGLVITMSIIELINNPEVSNVNILVTVLMMMGLVLMFIFDMVVLIIDKQVSLIDAAILYDIDNFKKDHKIFTLAIKGMGLDLHAEYPSYQEKKMKDKLHKIKREQDDKKARKRAFRRKYQK